MNDDLKKEIENRIHSICSCIVNQDVNQNIDLMSGQAGEVLFLAYYSRYFSKPEIRIVIQEKLENIFKEINSGSDFPTFSSGISGINWVLEHLVKFDFIEFDIDSLYESTDEILYECMLYYIKSKNYDFLHGALGIANYFANRNTQKTIRYINDFIENLLKNVINIEDSNSIGILSENKNGDKIEYVHNFSLSHGITSLLYFLDKCINSLDLDDNGKAKNLFNGLLNFFEINKNDISDYNSFYPSWLGINSTYKNARLGWCYGDLSIALIFLNFKSIDIKEKYSLHALDIINNTLKRKNPIEESILDAGICHGSSGLALLYNEAYLLTKSDSYLESSEYWLEHCLKINVFPDGVCGYKTYRGVEKGYLSDTGFLEGIAGIGLVLLAKLNVENRAWIECLMLN